MNQIYRYEKIKVWNFYEMFELPDADAENEDLTP